MNLILTILSALGSFIATNVDDIFVLMLLFSQAKAQTQSSNGLTHNMEMKGNRIYNRDIVIGQYLGFGILVLISLLATFGVTLIPDEMGGMIHPFHIHGTQFKILSRDGKEPPENERGWKDTISIQPDERVKIAIQFKYKGVYMLHCHILEHEDNGMMGQIKVE